MEKQRLDKFLSNQCAVSRTQIKEKIRKGLVSVNGKTQTDSAYQVNTDIDTVMLDGKPVKYKKFIYIMMNKPQGVLSASSDKRQKTVLDLIPENMYRAGLFPVGRLDKNTTGLLLITDDGEFAHNCISPKKEIEKCYIAELDAELPPDIAEKFAGGIVLADGTVCKPAVLNPLGKTTAEIKITEGKYHQIKRMFGILGLGVNRLHRKSIGALSLPESLEKGECTELEPDNLFNLIYFRQNDI